MAFAKTDLVPIPPEGDGWTLKSNRFFTGLVCSRCDGVRGDQYDTSICRMCGSDFSCFKVKAVLWNFWEKKNYFTYKVGCWFPKSVKSYSLLTAETYGPWKEIERCSDNPIMNKVKKSK